MVAHSSVWCSGGRRGSNRGEVHKTRLRGDENNVLKHVLLNLLPVLWLFCNKNKVQSMCSNAFKRQLSRKVHKIVFLSCVHIVLLCDFQEKLLLLWCCLLGVFLFTTKSCIFHFTKPYCNRHLCMYTSYIWHFFVFKNIKRASKMCIDILLNTTFALFTHTWFIFALKTSIRKSVKY